MQSPIYERRLPRPRRSNDISKRRNWASDQQISLTDPDSRSMAASGRGSGVVGYNVQVAVDTEHHLIVTHEMTNTGSDGRTWPVSIAGNVLVGVGEYKDNSRAPRQFNLRRACSVG
jgi:hypothetical protein